MTMTSFRPSFRGPTSRAARWLVAGACAVAVTTGLTIADADLASLRHDRDTAAAEVAAQTAVLHELHTANDTLTTQLAESRKRIAAHEHALSSRDGFLP